MTTPRQSQGAPPFDAVAQDVFAATRGERPRYVQPPQPEPPLTAEEKTKAAELERLKQVCPLCVGIHPLPGSPGCPRLATFELDGDGKVRAGSFFPGRSWAKGRVVLYEDLKEDDGDGAQH